MRLNSLVTKKKTGPTRLFLLASHRTTPPFLMHSLCHCVQQKIQPTSENLIEVEILIQSVISHPILGEIVGHCFVESAVFDRKFCLGTFLGVKLVGKLRSELENLSW